jgi:hypothetical protein
VLLKESFANKKAAAVDPPIRRLLFVIKQSISAELTGKGEAT